MELHRKGTIPLVELRIQDTVGVEEQMEFIPGLARCPSPPPLMAPAGFILSFSCLYPWRDWDCSPDDATGNAVTTLSTRGRHRHQVPSVNTTFTGFFQVANSPFRFCSWSLSNFHFSFMASSTSSLVTGGTPSDFSSLSSFRRFLMCHFCSSLRCLFCPRNNSG